MRLKLTCLGTGASGGTPGRGRSRRRESALLVEAGTTRILIDATRDFAAQSRLVEGPLDAVLLTHAHRDASVGLPQLARWQAAHDARPLPVLASAGTIAVVRARHGRLWPLALTKVAPGQTVRMGALGATPSRVPHAFDRRFPTYAWRLDGAGAIVYASDVARLEARLCVFARGADLLVIDGAMWGRPLYSHLRIDRELETLCRWPIERIVLTQIGRTAPPHAELRRRVAALCPRAMPAWDGLRLLLAPT
jgi:phosphoribosyl 1,2-cyclic phosphodiesterase